MQRSALKRARAQAKSQSGFTLIEALAALFLIALVMSGVVAAAATFHGATSLNRTRQIATTVANNAVEQARALSFNDLKLKPGTGAPLAYADSDCTAAAGNSQAGTCSQSDATIVMGAATCTSCIPFTYQTTQRGIKYVVTQMVLKLGSFVDNQGQTQTLKKLIVKVTWTTPKAGSTTVATILNNQDYLNPVTPTGVHVEVHDNGCVDDGSGTNTPIPGTCNTSPGATLDDSKLYWTVTIKDVNGNPVTGIPTQTTEGVLDATLTPGTYYCTMTNAGLGGTLPYFLMGTDTAPVTTIGCDGSVLAANSLGAVFTVVQGDTYNFVSQWTYSSTCKTSNTNGFIQLTVTNSDDDNPQPISGATLHLVNSNGTKTYDFKTDADGSIKTAGIPADNYSYSVNATGFSVYASTICVFANNTVPLTTALSTAPSQAGTLTVKINNTTKTAYTYQIVADGGSIAPSQQMAVGAGKNQTATFGNIPTGTYTVSVCEVATPCATVTPATQTATITNLTTFPLTWTDT